MGPSRSPGFALETHPNDYRHWRLLIEPPLATLTLAVAEDSPVVPGYKLKLNSYDLGVDIELADAVARFSRIAWRIVWLTPLAGDPGFEPRTAGLVAARPFLDVLGDGGSIDQICAHVLQLADAKAA